MIVSGVRTSSGFEERIRFKELEIIDRDAIDSGVLSTLPEGNYINGWDVNVAGVRITSVKRNIRYHKHAVGHNQPRPPLLLAGARHLTCSRSFFFGSRGKGSSSTSSVGATETTTGCTRRCETSCLARCSRHCPRRTRPTRRRQICSAASLAAGTRRRRPCRPCRLM